MEDCCSRSFAQRTVHLSSKIIRRSRERGNVSVDACEGFVEYPSNWASSLWSSNQGFFWGLPPQNQIGWPRWGWPTTVVRKSILYVIELVAFELSTVQSRFTTFRGKVHRRSTHVWSRTRRNHYLWHNLWTTSLRRYSRLEFAQNLAGIWIRWKSVAKGLRRTDQQHLARHYTTSLTLSKFMSWLTIICFKSSITFSLLSGVEHKSRQLILSSRRTLITV